MFRTTKRDILRVPMGLFQDQPEKDPVFLVQYIPSAKRQAIIDRETKSVFYPSPGGIHIKRLALGALMESDAFKDDYMDAVRSIIADEHDAETVLKDVERVLKSHLARIPETQSYIEKTETNDIAIVSEIVELSIVGWENILDDETGESIPFSKSQLRAWMEEGDLLFHWMAKRLPEVFKEFDTLLAEQKASAEKN